MATRQTPSRRVAVRRHPERGQYDLAVIEAILDEALYCHVGFVKDGQPVVIPTIHVRLGSLLYIHGAVASSMLKVLADGTPIAVTVTLVDGIVLARSAYNHSLNYRSVVVLGTASEVTDGEEKLQALEALVEHVMPGRWADARFPTDAELRATRLLKIPVVEASAKIRQGPPTDDPGDMDLPIWAGVVPVGEQRGLPVPDPALASSVPWPSYFPR